MLIRHDAVKAAYMQLGVQVRNGDLLIRLKLGFGLGGRITLFEEACRRLIIDENLSGSLEEGSFGIIRTQDDTGRIV